MPGSGQPSVVVARASSSSRRVAVTAPFSDMPHAEMTAVPSVGRALPTRVRGMGAPAETKTRSEGVRLSGTMAGLVTDCVAMLRG